MLVLVEIIPGFGGRIKKGNLMGEHITISDRIYEDRNTRADNQK